MTVQDKHNTTQKYSVQMLCYIAQRPILMRPSYPLRIHFCSSGKIQALLWKFEAGFKQWQM